MARKRRSSVQRQVQRDALVIAKRVPSRLLEPIPVKFYEDDLRRFDPRVLPIRVPRERRLHPSLLSQIRAVVKSPPKWQFRFVPRSPLRDAMVCVRRKARREVLLALGKGGGGKRKKRRTPRSEVSCR